MYETASNIHKLWLYSYVTDKIFDYTVYSNWDDHNELKWINWHHLLWYVMKTEIYNNNLDDHKLKWINWHHLLYVMKNEEIVEKQINLDMDQRSATTSRNNQ